MSHLTPPPMLPVPPVYASTNHTLHLIISVLTCGLWLLVWPFVVLAVNASNRSKKSAYERQLADYQNQVWLREQAQEPKSGEGAGYRSVGDWWVSGENRTGYGDPRAGYRPAAGRGPEEWEASGPPW